VSNPDAPTQRGKPGRFSRQNLPSARVQDARALAQPFDSHGLPPSRRASGQDDAQEPRQPMIKAGQRVDLCLSVIGKNGRALGVAIASAW
jgi:hypothetical protein